MEMGKKSRAALRLDSVGIHEDSAVKLNVMKAGHRAGIRYTA